MQRHSKTVRRTAGVAGAAALSIATMAAIRPEPIETVEPATAPPTAVATVQIAPVDGYETTRRFTGVLDARRDSNLGFRPAGIIASIDAVEGARVDAGDVLAALDTAPLRSKRHELVARRAAAAARLDEMIAGARAEVVAHARATLEALEARAERLRLRAARMIDLHGRDAANDDELDGARFDLAAAAAERDAAAHALDELVNGTRPEQIAAQRAVVAELDAMIASIEVDLDDSVIRAPFDGRIDRHLAETGEFVAAGVPVIRIVERDAIEAWIGVPIEYASAFEVGDTRSVLVGAHAIEARVAAVLPDLDERTRTVRVALRFEDGSDARLVPGRIAELEHRVLVDEAGAWLPSDALVRGRRGLWSVYVAEPGERGTVARRTDVEVLHADGDRVFVRGAFPPASPVIAGGLHRIVPGQHVEPLRTLVSSN